MACPHSCDNQVSSKGRALQIHTCIGICMDSQPADSIVINLDEEQGVGCSQSNHVCRAQGSSPVQPLCKPLLPTYLRQTHPCTVFGALVQINLAWVYAAHPNTSLLCPHNVCFPSAYRAYQRSSNCVFASRALQLASQWAQWSCAHRGNALQQ